MRTRNLYKPGIEKPYKLSRSKIALYLECRRCFYLDRKRGVSRPDGYVFNLNLAVDKLLKQEFDIHRVKGERHVLQETYDITAKPAKHKKLSEWRENFKGIQFLHEATNFLVTGAIDDLWVNEKGEFIIVDYKATSRNWKITNMNHEMYNSYKRQLDIYQWLFRQNDFAVSNTGYFIYANAIQDRQAFDAKLEFDVTVVPYEGNDDWVDGTLGEIFITLNSDTIPEVTEGCTHCQYSQDILEVLGEKSDTGQATLL